MYDELVDLTEPERVEVVTRKLVAIPSINGTNGEVILANEIESILRSFPFFRDNANLVWTQELPNDRLHRKNVFALLPYAESDDTVIFHSHFDTVGVDDFGGVRNFAYNPDALQEYFQSYEDDADIQADAQSNEWLFGRGALDMKSGDAVNMINLLHFIENPDEQTGNVLFMANCVEENDHSGMISALSELSRLKTDAHLNFKAAINTDFISPKYIGDQQKYIYYGAAGKTLACFYVKGVETHVGNTYDGLDSTVIASQINVLLNNNPDFTESIPGEEVLPASCLFLRDQKDFYNVQTAKVSELYFNVFTYKRPVFETLQLMKNAVQLQCDKFIDLASKRQVSYLESLNLPVPKTKLKLPVFTFDEYISNLETKFDVPTLIQDFIIKHPQLDKRKSGFELIDYLEEATNETSPKVILFIAPPFCPHNSVEAGSALYLQIGATLSEYSTQYPFVMKQFFPYLSDSSYLAVDESDDEIARMTANFPLSEQLYPLPYDEMRKLNIPAIDVGVFGKGAHTWKERVYKPYSFELLPELIRNLTTKILTTKKEVY